MSLATTTMFLRRLMGIGDSAKAPGPDPAEMGTAYGLEASLTPEEPSKQRRSRRATAAPPASSKPRARR